MAVATGLSIEDFEKLPDDLAHYRELVDGELIDVSGNTLEHNDMRDLLAERLRAFVRAKKLGRVMTEQEFAFGANAHGPDLTFCGPAKASLCDRKRRVQLFVPDLAIEIASENDRFNSLLKKIHRYRDAGTREAWIISIETREAFVYSESGDRVLSENGEFSSPLLPGFAVSLRELFDSI